MNRTEEFIKDYLKAIDIKDYSLTHSKDGDKTIFFLKVSRRNGNTGVLLGLSGKNSMLLKKMLSVVGHAEGLSPFVIIKLTD
jgi:hypothetical protein